jgi:O-antigen ligase
MTERLQRLPRGAPLGLAILIPIVLVLTVAFDSYGVLLLASALALVVAVAFALGSHPEMLWVACVGSLVLVPFVDLRFPLGPLLVPISVFAPIVAIAVSSVRALMSRQVGWGDRAIVGALAITLLGHTLSLFSADALYASGWSLLKWVFHAVLFFFLVRFQSREWHLRAVVTLILVTGVLSLYGLYEFVRNDGYDVNFYREVATRTATGLHLALVLPWAIALGIWGRLRPAVRAAVWVAIGASLTAVTLTYSRTAWISILAALAVVTLLQRRLGRVAFLVLTLLALLYLGELAPADVQDRFWSTFSVRESRDKSVTNALRLDLQELAIDQIGRSPLLGVGLGNYTKNIPWYRYNRSSPEANVPHNYYLLIWAEGGLLAFGGFVGMLVLCLRRSVRAVRQAIDPRERLVLGGALGSLVALVVFLAFADDFNNLVVWTVLGLVVSGSRLMSGSVETVSGDSSTTEPAMSVAGRPRRFQPVH